MKISQRLLESGNADSEISRRPWRNISGRKNLDISSLNPYVSFITKIYSLVYKHVFGSNFYEFFLYLRFRGHERLIRGSGLWGLDPSSLHGKDK